MERLISKKLISIFFRIFLILASIGYYVYFDINIRPVYFIILVIAYIIIYFFLIFKERPLSFFRIINDYTLLTITTYSGEANNLSLILLSLPLINNQNHSGKKKSLLPYLLFYISTHLLNNYHIAESLFVIICIGYLNFISDSILKFYQNRQYLNKYIDEFIDKSDTLNKPHKIYNDLLEALNEINLLPFFSGKFINIICFTSSSTNSPIIENSHLFCWSLNLSDEWRNDKDTYFNQHYLINGKKSNYNITINNQTGTQKYSFVFILNEYNSTLSQRVYAKLLRPSAARIARLIDFEKMANTVQIVPPISEC